MPIERRPTAKEVIDELPARLRGRSIDAANGVVRVRVDAETGTVVWPGGADLAPDTLYERVRSGAWPDRAALHNSPARASRQPTSTAR